MATQNRTASPRLTPAAIERLPPGDYHDSGARGLVLRVTEQGTRTFRWRLRSAGKVVTLGEWSRQPRQGFITLGEAHALLENLKAAHKEGRLDAFLGELHPAPAPKQEPLGALTVKEIAEDFKKYLAARRKRPEQAERCLRCDILPALEERPVASITSRDVRGVVESVVARGSSTQAGTVLQVMKQLFRFAQGRDELAANPCAALDPGMLGVVANRCNRYLSAEEVPLFWKALDKGMTPTVRAALRLLLLLGCRSGELLRAEWSEVDFDAATWTVPVAHQKLTKRQEMHARPWVVPLPPMALELFKELHVFAKSLGSRYVLASLHGDGEALTEKALNHAMRRLFVGPKAPLEFAAERPTPHDLRRTLRTHLGELGIPFHVAERCLNHSLGRMPDIYDRGDYLTERRAALEKWSAYIERLTTPGESTVAFLPSRGA